MILVTRLNGAAFAVNPDLLERVEATPDTVLTLIDGTKYLVAETVGEVIELVRDYRASVVASARGHCEHEADARPEGRSEHRPTRTRTDAPHLQLAPAVPDAAPASVIPLPTAGTTTTEEE